MRILIADDDAQDSEVLSNFLSRKGHKVRTVDRGTDALEVAPVFRPHVVFLDLCIPGIDGWGVCERLRVSDHAEDAVIFALTTDSATEYAARCRHARFDAYLAKPVELDLAGRLVNCSSQ